MKSIRSKFILLSLAGVLFTSAVQGSAGLLDFKRITELDSAQLMNLHCAVQAQVLDGLFLRIEQSAHLLEGHVLRALLDLQDLQRDETLRSKYSRAIRNASHNVAAYTKGALSSFVRFAPGIAPADFDIYCHYDPESDSFREFPITDLSKYAPDQREYVGWFYEPAAKGRPMWMKPYYNANTKRHIFSYVIPMFKEGRFIGVVGMDVDFSQLRDAVSAVDSEYEKGKSFLTDGQGVILYHKDMPTGTHWPTAFKLSAIPDLTLPDTGEDGLISYFRDGEEKRLAYRSLRNGMRFALSSKVEDLYRESDELLRKTIWHVCIIATLFALITLWVTNRITSPIRELSAAIRRMGAGDLDVKVEHRGSDEIGQMADAFQSMAEQLKARVTNIRCLAYQDALTGIRNKTAFMDLRNRLLEDMDKGTARFALMMLDVNGLKQVNDRLGHTTGDQLIQEACRIICQAFKRSPVFRVGGDEFIVVLENADLDNLNDIMRTMQESIDERNRKSDSGFYVSIASGVAHYAEGMSLEGLLKEADENMYRNKAVMKGMHSGFYPDPCTSPKNVASF